jgi:hypothetical protein
MTLEDLRAKYPQYSDVSDDKLVESFHQKFYPDMPLADFQQKLGIKPPAPPAKAPEAVAAGNALDRLLAQTKEVGREATQFAVGAGKGLAGTGEFLVDALTQGISPQVNKLARSGFDPLKERFKQTEQILNPSGDFNVAGTAGEMMSPAGLGVAKGLGIGKGVVDKTLRGAVSGATTGATQLGEDNMGAGAGIGAGIGGTLAVANKFIGRPVIEMIKYFTPGGAARMANRYTNEIVGPENVQKIVADIEEQLSRQGTGTFVPGYQKTLGETVSHMPAASPLLALEKATAAGPRGISEQFGQRAADQRSAIEQALRPIAGTPEELASAVGKRSAIDRVNYGAAAGTDKDKAVMPLLMQLQKQPYFNEVYNEAALMGTQSGKLDLTTLLHNAKVILEDKMTATGDATLNRAKRALTGNLIEELTTGLGKANPLYDTARTVSKANAVPVNRMRVGQALEEKLVSPTDQMMPGGYLRAIDNETKLIKDATGRPRSNFGQVFSGQEQATINEIGQLLEGKLAAQKPLQATRIGGNDIADQAVIHLPQLLSRPVAMANWAVKQITASTGNLEARVDKVNAARMLDPAKFAEAMKTLPSGERAMIEKALGAAKYQGLIAPAVNSLED